MRAFRTYVGPRLRKAPILKLCRRHVLFLSEFDNNGYFLLFVVYISNRFEQTDLIEESQPSNSTLWNILPIQTAPCRL